MTKTPTSNNNTDTKLSKRDIILWLSVALLAVTGVWANEHYANIDWALRAAAWLIIALAALAVASWTTHGRMAWEFGKEAKRELKKVSWPKREEAAKTTLMVVVIVVIMSVILWGIDSLLFWLVGKIMS